MWEPLASLAKYKYVNDGDVFLTKLLLEYAMNLKLSTVALSLFTALAAQAQTPAPTEAPKAPVINRELQRDVNQQTRIEEGLKSGELSTREAAKLEKKEAGVDRMQANALKDGKLSKKEAVRIENAQDKVSKDIYAQKHDAQQGNPNSASSQRMQAAVQRDVNQEKRIQAGVQNGSLTNKEVGKLQRGQARDDRQQARAGADGHMGARESKVAQKRENKQSKRIYKQKHDAQTRS
jgi:hypothetical protein